MTKLTPMKAIRAKCLDCCCGQAKEVRLCTMEKCPLHPYRFGKRPKTMNISDEEVDTEKSEIDRTFFSNKAR